MLLCNVCMDAIGSTVGCVDPRKYCVYFQLLLIDMPSCTVHSRTHESTKHQRRHVPFPPFHLYMMLPPNRRGKQTEEKAKVVAAVWGTEFIQFLAALQIYHQEG